MDAGPADHRHAATGNGRHRSRLAGCPAAQAQPDKPIVLSVKADRSLALGGHKVTKDAPGEALDKLSNGDKDQSIVLRAVGYLHVALAVPGQ